MTKQEAIDILKRKESGEHLSEALIKQAFAVIKNDIMNPNIEEG
jgi:hypothetical protein